MLLIHSFIHLSSTMVCVCVWLWWVRRGDLRGSVRCVKVKGKRREGVQRWEGTVV